MKVLVTAGVTLVAATLIAAAPARFYDVEYKRPQPNNAVAMLNVTFYSGPISEAVADSLIKAELTIAVQVYPPTTDVLGWAWMHKDGSSDSEDAQIGASHNFPAYSFKLKKIVTQKEMFAAEKN